MPRIEIVLVVDALEAVDARDLGEKLYLGYRKALKELAFMDDYGQQQWPVMVERFERLVSPEPWPILKSLGCVSCEEGVSEGECPNSRRACRHHCNHSWSHDSCCWCSFTC